MKSSPVRRTRTVLSRLAASAAAGAILLSTVPASAMAAGTDSPIPEIISSASTPVTLVDESSTSRTTTDGPVVSSEIFNDAKITPCSHDFTDVAPKDTFYDAVTWMACDEMTHGYGDGSFGRNRKITRGEVASFLFRYSGEKHIAGKTKDFPDVTPSSIHFKAISWMDEHGLTTGYKDGTFGLDRNITRAELAAFLFRLNSNPDYVAPAAPPFTDVKASASQYRPISWMKSTGVIRGYADGSFRAGRNVTRGETAQYFYAVESHLNGTPAKPATQPKPYVPPKPAPTPAPKPKPAPALPTGPNYYTTVSTNIYASNSYSSKKLSAVPAQQPVMRLGSKGQMTKVRRGNVVGWVNSMFLTVGKPGTSDKPFSNPHTYERRATNNMAKWCWNVPVTTMPGTGGRAGYTASSRGGDNMVVTEYIKLGNAWDSQHPGSVAIQLHECAHIMQYRAYKYDYSALNKAMESVYPGGYSSGVEHMADCMTDVMGGKRAGKTYWVGYGGTCSSAQYAAARKILAGQQA
ncbi:S-layer homology domain-containing protein (plasmid) [Citricoccus nitrophenolicus]